MAQGAPVSGKDQSPLIGQGSQQQPTQAFGDINVPLTVTGPTLEVQLGFYGPRDGENIKWGAVACLAEDPTAAKCAVSCKPGSKRGTVIISVYKLTAGVFAAADAATVTKVNLIATRGSAVAQ